MLSVLPLLLAAKVFSVDGIVVAVDRTAGTMLVSHRAIGRYMPAMMMPFRAADRAELAALHPGARVEFELVVDRSQSAARRIRQVGTGEIPPPKEMLRVGDVLPQFRLTDQDGRTVREADLRGRVTAINFLYTRCPLPDVCPRLAANFALLQRRFGDRVLLLSVTVDPDYDTPAVLADYARRWRADTRNWRFLTGDVSPLAAALGEVYWFDEGSIGHNSTTAVIGQDGRIAALVEGSNYRSDQLVNLVAHELGEVR